jgi:hypothetical protein
VIDFSKIPSLAETCYKVNDRIDPHKVVPFLINSAQRDFLKLCAQIQEQKALTWIIAIKPRRVGLSRIVSAIGVTMAFSYNGLAGRVMAHLGDTLEEIMAAMRMMARGLPGHKNLSKDFRIEIGKSVISGSKALAVGTSRGTAAQFLHLTEAAHYPLKSPMTAILPVVPRSRDTFIAIESTANPDRRGRAFREYWENARWINEDKKDRLFVRYFCPWTKDPYAWADKRLARDAPIDDEERLLMAAGVERERIAWRRSEIASRYQGRPELFEMENPSTPDAAFLVSDVPAFSNDEKAWALQTVVEPLMRGTFRPTTNHPESLVRLYRDPNGPWRIYEERKRNCEYYIGVDAARGRDVSSPETKEESATDYAAIVVINGSTSAVAAVLEERWLPNEIAHQTALAGRYYCTREISDYHYALVNVEVTGGYGGEVQIRLKKDEHYPIHRFLRWKGRDDRIHDRPGQNIGWISTVFTNELKLTVFRMALSSRQFLVRDRRLAEQIQIASETSLGDAEVERGHDDVLDATMFAWIARDMQRPRYIATEDTVESAIAPRMISVYEPGAWGGQKVWEFVEKRLKTRTKVDHLREMLDYINNPEVGDHAWQ